MIHYSPDDPKSSGEFLRFFYSTAVLPAAK